MHRQEAERVLYELCLVTSEPAVSLEALNDALEAIAPILYLELDARCPECGQPNAVYFDIQSFLLGALLQERKVLLSEVHRIAVAYGWGLDAILSLKRSERRSYVAFIEAEMYRNRRVFA